MGLKQLNPLKIKCIQHFWFEDKCVFCMVMLLQHWESVV